MQHQLFCQEGNSNKFWNISTDGTELTVQYGRVGTAGQRQQKTFASAEACEKEATRLLNEKRRKGYTELTAGEAVPEKKAGVPPSILRRFEYELRLGLLPREDIIERMYTAVGEDGLSDFQAEGEAGETQRQACFAFMDEQEEQPGGFDQWLENQYDVQLAAQRERERQFPPVTDFDRLERAFSELRREGWVIAHMAGETKSDGLEVIGSDETEESTGYCFYHEQCVRGLIDKPFGLLLYYGALPTLPDDQQAQQDLNDTAAGHRLVAALQAQGLRTSWTGSNHSAVEVTDFTWQKRFDGLDWATYDFVPPAPAPVALRRELLAGRRVKLLAAFTESLLGSEAVLTQLLEAHGATVLGTAASEDKPFDFYLGTHVFTIPHEDWWARRPTLFEEELLVEPAFPGPGLLPGLRLRFLAMFRQLLFQPNVQVSSFRLGLPATEAALAAAEAKVRQPLPSGLRALYQQAGEIRLLWLYRVPVRPFTLATLANTANYGDYDELHDGSIQIGTPEVLLSDQWHAEGLYYFDLTAKQWVFDYYSNYYLVAVELGKKADPVVLLGDDYGVSFSELPMPLSGYLDLVLLTYGDRDREAFAYQPLPAGSLAPPTGAGEVQLDPPPNALGFAFGNKDSYAAYGEDPVLDDEDNLAELARLLDRYAAADLPDHYFALLHWALRQPDWPLTDYESLAQDKRYFDTPRYQQLRVR